MKILMVITVWLQTFFIIFLSVQYSKSQEEVLQGLKDYNELAEDYLNHLRQDKTKLAEEQKFLKEYRLHLKACSNPPALQNQ